MIFVDELRRYPSGWWCHMASDKNEKELHEFARRIGLQRRWFQGRRRVPHYDLRKSKRIIAVTKGAAPVENKELFKKCAVLV